MEYGNRSGSCGDKDTLASFIPDGADFRIEVVTSEETLPATNYIHTRDTLTTISASESTTLGRGFDEWTVETKEITVEEKEEEFNPYIFIKNLPIRQLHNGIEDGTTTTLLPPLLSTDPKYCLVLDLDETLVHCSTEPLSQPDLIFPVLFNSVEYTVRAVLLSFLSPFAPFAFPLVL